MNGIMRTALLGLLLALTGNVYAGEQPNLYELWGKHVQLSYSTSSLAGVPLLHYQYGKDSWDFKGDEIRVVSTELGQQVTVTLQEIADLQTVTLTLLIPDINLVDQVAPFKTEAITTIHRTSIGGPDLVKGQIQQYRAQTLHGQASQVVFLGEQAPAVKGAVTLSPCPGPERPGQNCVLPYAGATVQLLDGVRNVVASGLTNALGAFNLPANPGRYTVHINVDGVLPRCLDVPVSLPKQGSTYVTVRCDSGMR